ncbi:hypothetical protein F0562_035895 [Nyssa sinensis]|uniref:Uncharacterized protein n=1 Tax=Nyssa sinensis TaxID=561372 RepID=A0A5J5AD29_9ASTE|nr:hypothetical protein F0562_035895 [Nyssa sinensis]
MEGGGSEGEKKKPLEGENKVKRKMKTALQLEILEKTYAVETRLKDRKALPVKRPRKDTSPAVAVVSSSVAGDKMVVDEVGNKHAPCTINRPPSSPTIPHQRN